MAHRRGGMLPRVAVHGFVLLIANFLAIGWGLVASKLAAPAGQIAVQAPVAAAVSVALFVCWAMACNRLGVLQAPAFHRNVEWWWTLTASLVWGPVVFVPLHYVTQGYLTSAGNIGGLLVFQVPVNAIAVLMASRFTRTQ